MNVANTTLAVAAGVALGGFCLCGVGTWLLTPHGMGSKPQRKPWTREDGVRLFEETVARAARDDAVERYRFVDGNPVVVKPQAGAYRIVFRLEGGAKATLHSLEGLGDAALVPEFPSYSPCVGTTEVPKGWDRATSVRVEGAKVADVAFLTEKPEP